MGGLIAGIAVSSLVSAFSGYMGAKAQKEAYETLANATADEKAEFQKAYDESFGPGTYNAKMQELGQQAGQQYYDMVNDAAAWDRYINGDKAYVAPQDFTFTERQFTDDPSYKVRLGEGLAALDQSNVASGLNLSGAAQRATNDYAQEQASKEFSNAYNRAFQRYTDDRNFDFNAWKTEADRYYANLQAQLAGLGNVSNQGAMANQQQTAARTNLAGQNAAAIQQQTQAQAAADMAGTQQWTSVLDNIAKGINTGTGLYASKAGATPSSTTQTSPTPVNTTPVAQHTLEQGMNNGGQDFANLFLAGWNPAIQTPNTGNLIGA